jgi:tRNA dimethylallyltransferase
LSVAADGGLAGRAEAPPRVLVLAGPTASGKTATGLALARRFGGELIGADSVQVYRGFDIGSAKPTAAELDGVPHHLIDIVDPDEAIDARRYADTADEAIAAVAARGRVPIVVGGTGLWLRALLRGLLAVPEVDPALRARLEAEADRDGAPALHARLATVDPRAAAAIHENDRLRVVRALEVFEQTGQPLGELRHAHALGAPRYDALFAVLDPGPPLTSLIEDRLDAMLAAGWREETRALHARYPTARALGSVGYRQLVLETETGAPPETTRQAIRKATRIYARRQRTWFKGEPGVTIRTRAEDLLLPSGLDTVERFLEGRAATSP